MLVKKQKMEGAVAVRYPPYTDRKHKILRFIMVKHPAMLKLKMYRQPLKLLLAIIALLAFYLRRK